MLIDFHVISPIMNSSTNILGDHSHAKTEFQCKVPYFLDENFKNFENYFFGILKKIFVTDKKSILILVLYDTTTEKQVLPLQLEIEVLLEEYEVIDNHQGTRVHRTPSTSTWGLCGW